MQQPSLWTLAVKRYAIFTNFITIAPVCSELYQLFHNLFLSLIFYYVTAIIDAY